METDNDDRNPESRLRAGNQREVIEANEHVYPDSRISDVMSHPAFDGKGKLLFPWDDSEHYREGMTMEDVPDMNLWHTNHS